MNQNKFCFIICSNNEIYLRECMLYLNRLNIPPGYEMECLEIAQAKSMAGGYNEGMESTDAKYKIYMHHDVFILNTNFLVDILRIFQSDQQIGMIGMVGAPEMPADGVMWHTERVGYNQYSGSEEACEYSTGALFDEKEVTEVEAIDGFIMITQYDRPWCEELFDGWDFYDISQCYEMKKAGWKVVVPNQTETWCLHDGKILNLNKYNHYRQIFLDYYPL